MLEIAGGIILAILILWVLWVLFAALARPVFKVLAYLIGLYVLIMAAGFACLAVVDHPVTTSIGAGTAFLAWLVWYIRKRQSNPPPLDQYEQFIPSPPIHFRTPYPVVTKKRFSREPPSNTE